MTIYENIKGFIPTSLVDWEGKVASVIFVSGCNFRCGFCSNKELVLTPEKPKTIKFEDIKKYLLKNADFIDGVVISGGEPTLQRELALFCEEIKKLGFMVKLDSNGSHPEVLKILKEKKLVDYAAMDIKVVKEKYEEITNNKTDLGKIEESMKIISPENFQRLRVIERACHYIPSWLEIIFFACRRNLLGEKQEERFVFYGTDCKISFWPIETKSCSLTACNNKSGNSTV